MRKHKFSLNLRKKCILLLCIFFTPMAIFANQDLQNMKITLNMKNVPLKEIFKEIERQTQYSFYYNEKQIDSKKTVNVTAENQEVASILNEVLSDYSFRTEKNMIIVTPKTTSSTSGSAGAQQQTIPISGTIVDEAGEPLIGASVTFTGTQAGTVTDVNGNFSLNVPDLKGTLTISYIGFKNKLEPINGKKVINIVMEADSEILDEVVVVGYGTQRKKDMTGGVSSLNTEKLEKIPTTNVAKRLQGQVAGMAVTVSTIPGGTTATDRGTTIRIRGEKSLSGSNEPLIILDGIPFNGGLDQVDQNSVENISVLKDASAAAIYGSRAANGVILITTKKGQQGKPVVRYNGYVAVQTPERLFDIQNGKESMDFLKQYWRDSGAKEEKWQNPENFLQSTPKANYLAGKEFDWQDEIFKPAFQQEHQLSISGASDKSNYYASISYTDQDGMVKNTPFQKYAATLNLSQKIGKWLTVGTNTQLMQTINNGVTPDYSMAYRLSPYSNPYNEDGTYNRYPMYTETFWYNPYVDQDGTSDDMYRNVFTGWYADVLLPVKGLTYRTNFGYAYSMRERGSYYGSTTLTGADYNGVAKITNNDYTDWTWENVVKYDRDFKLHHLDFTGMISAQKTTTSEASAEGRNFLSDNNTYHNIDAAQGEKIITSDYTVVSQASYMGRINYNYASKYLLTFTARYDGCSSFGENNKWALFPSVAAGWVASEEKFFQNWGVEQIDFLKFRMSYGSNGNQAIRAYQTLNKMAQRDYIYGDGSSFAAGLYNTFERGNPSLRWETTYSFNAGLDFGLFRNRLVGNLEMYSANTKDLLMNRTVVIMNGYNKMMDNVGKTHTKGIELTLNTVNIKKKDFEWNTSFVGAGNWNTITALREDGKDDIGNSWFIGKPIRVFYDYKVIGVWQSGEETEAAKFGAKPGDARLWDKNQNEKLDPEDRTVIGSKLPVWTAGMTNTFTYKDWTFSFFLNGVFDITKENGTLNFNGRQFAKNTNFINGINYWTPENPSNEATRLAYMPKNSHKFYSDASFVRIQDINLSYNVPKAFTDKLSLQKLTAYINASNIYTFSGVNKYGINPEQDIIGNTSSYPVPRTFVFGLNVTF